MEEQDRSVRDLAYRLQKLAQALSTLEFAITSMKEDLAIAIQLLQMLSNQIDSLNRENRELRKKVGREVEENAPDK